MDERSVTGKMVNTYIYEKEKDSQKNSKPGP